MDFKWFDDMSDYQKLMYFSSQLGSLSAHNEKDNFLNLLLYALASGFDMETRLKHKGWNLLHIMTDGNHLEGIKFVLFAGASIDSVDEDGNTALILAVKLKHSVEIINFLLDHGADIDHKNNEGISSFMFAAIDNNNVLKRLLKERGAVSSNKDLLAARVRYCNDFNYDPELRMQALIGVEARVNFIIQ